MKEIKVKKGMRCKIPMCILVLILLSMMTVYLIWKPWIPNYIEIQMGQEKIHIYRDKLNIPHIHADTKEGAWVGFGYVHA